MGYIAPRLILANFESKGKDATCSGILLRRNGNESLLAQAASAPLFGPDIAASHISMPLTKTQLGVYLGAALHHHPPGLLPPP
jgi:hypothetical protein